MSLRIFETDPEAKPRKRDNFSTDVTFNLKSGIAINNVPQALDDWGFTSDDPTVINELMERYGGDEVEELDVAKGDDLRVLSTTRTLDVLVADAAALRSRMILFGRNGPIHICDGVYFVEGDDKGEPCGCPTSMADRKAAAKSGRGPSPSVELKFLLKDNPELGFGRFRTGSWSLVNDLTEIEDALDAAVDEADGAPVLVRLSLKRVEYTTKLGRDVSYVRPVVEVLGSQK